MGWIIEQNLVAVLTAAVAFVSSWAINKTKVENLEKRVESLEGIVSENKLTLERLQTEAQSTKRRLDQIESLKIEANLAEIKADLSHIRALLEQKN